MKSKNFYLNYWDQNIHKWSGHYTKITKKNEEIFTKNIFLKVIYDLFIYNLEKKATLKRLKIAKAFLSVNKSKKKILNDIGAGTGYVTKNFLNKYRKVNFIDFSSEAINYLKIIKKNSKVYKIDITKQRLIHSDISICLGVTPYIETKYQRKVLKNILHHSDKILIHYLDRDSIFNKIRIIFNFLNVRKVNFFEIKFLDKFYKVNKILLEERIYFGTGFCDILNKKNQKII